MAKQTFHRFNKNIDKEPERVSTGVQADTRKLEKATFTPDIRVEEVQADIQIDSTANLKDLFTELGTLLTTEETMNTNPYPSTGIPSDNAPAKDPTPPLPVPVDTVVRNADEEEPEETPPAPVKVQEATVQDFHSVADHMGRPRLPTPPEPAPVAEAKPKKWVFKVIRNNVGLIDTIEATAS